MSKAEEMDLVFADGNGVARRDTSLGECRVIIASFISCRIPRPQNPTPQQAQEIDARVTKMTKEKMAEVKSELEAKGEYWISPHTLVMKESNATEGSTHATAGQEN